MIDRKTWVHFHLARSLPIKWLLQEAIGWLKASGYKETPRWTATLANSGDYLAGESLSDVLPDNRTLVAIYGSFSASCCPVVLKLQIEGSEATPFLSTTLWANFTVTINCEMHSRLLGMDLSQETAENREAELARLRFAYASMKRLFKLASASKCVGVDDRYFTGEYFDDPPSFLFVVEGESVLSPLLE